jgi:hypothetical protein
VADSMLIGGEIHRIERIPLDALADWKQRHGLTFDRSVWLMRRVGDSWQRERLAVYRRTDAVHD